MENYVQFILKFIVSSLLFSFFCFVTFAQDNKVINSTGKSFQNSYSGMDFNIGEPITTTISNGNLQISQGFLQPEGITTPLKVFIEGYYQNSSHSMPPLLYNNHYSTDSSTCDYITIELHHPIQKDSIAYTFKTILHTNGNAGLFVPFELQNHRFYTVIKHRNSIEIWSKKPILFDSQLTEIDFTKGFDLNTN